jgi:hypothetical protein
METINNNVPIMVLFGKMNIYSLEDLETFISKLTPEQAQYCLIECIKYSFRHNIFTLEESELISKSIRVLSQPIDTK